MLGIKDTILLNVLNGVDTCTGGPGSNCTPPGLDDFEKVISNVTNIALGLISTIALIFLIQGAILYMSSGGNPDQISKAKNTIFYSIIGLVLAIGSWVIIKFVIGAF